MENSEDVFRTFRSARSRRRRFEFSAPRQPEINDNPQHFPDFPNSTLKSFTTPKLITLFYNKCTQNHFEVITNHRLRVRTGPQDVFTSIVWRRHRHFRLSRH